MWIIYKRTFLPFNISYVGITSQTLEERWQMYFTCQQEQKQKQRLIEKEKLLDELQKPKIYIEPPQIKNNTRLILEELENKPGMSKKYKTHLAKMRKLYEDGKLEPELLLPKIKKHKPKKQQDNKSKKIIDYSNNSVQGLVNQFGDGEFWKHEILAQFQNPFSALEAEQKYIQEYNTLTPNGLNKTIGGELTSLRNLKINQIKEWCKEWIS